jgi:hypothetical protein
MLCTPAVALHETEDRFKWFVMIIKVNLFFFCELTKTWFNSKENAQFLLESQQLAKWLKPLYG